MPNRKKPIVVALLLLGSCCGVEAFAQSARPVTTKELVERAQKIVAGEVVEQRSAWDELGREIYTFTTVRVQRIIKSERADSILIIRQLGGKVGNIESHVAGAPSFVPGERVLLMLGPYAGTPYHDLIDWHQGKYTIKTDANRGEVLSGNGDGHGQRVEEFTTTLRRYL